MKFVGQGIHKLELEHDTQTHRRGRTQYHAALAYGKIRNGETMTKPFSNGNSE